MYDELNNEREESEKAGGYNANYQDAKDIGEKIDQWRNNNSSNSSAPKGNDIPKSNNNASGPKGGDIPKGEASSSAPSVPQGADIGSQAGNVGSTVGNAAGNATGNAVRNAAGEMAGNAAGEMAVNAAGNAVGNAAGAAAGGAETVGVGAVAAGTGAASFGIGAVITIAVALGTKAVSKLLKTTKKNVNEVLDNQKSSSIGNVASAILVLIAFMCLIVVPILTPISAFSSVIDYGKERIQEVVNTGENYVKGSLNKYSAKGQFFAELFEVEELGDLQLYNEIYSQQQVDANNVVIYKAIIDKGIENAYNNYVTQYTQAPETFFPNLISSFFERNGFSIPGQFSSNAALINLYNQTYYYSFPKEDGTPYTVGEYLRGEIPKEDLNNDVNYAEIITVFSQKEDYAYYQMSYSEFYDAIAGKDHAGMFFEMTLDEEQTYFYWNDDEHTSFTVCDSAEDAKKKAREKHPEIDYDEDDSSDESEEGSADEGEEPSDENSSDEVTKNGNYGWGYFYDVTILPYGLDEIYAAAEINPFAENYIQPDFTNYDTLDVQEGFLRSYLGEETYLGPSGTSERVLQKGNTNLTSPWKELYDAFDMENTGRTALKWCFNSVTTMEIGTLEDIIGQTGNGIVVNYRPNGTSVILDISEKYGFYQTGGPWKNVSRGDGRYSIGDSACIDCCYMMTAEYFNNKTYDITKISSSTSSGGYVSGQSFQIWKFCEDFGIGWRRLDPTTASIVSELARGNVCELCIGGVTEKRPWISDNGIVLHNTKEHHLLIVGYDDDGFYFVDPGSSYVTTTKLSFKTFSNAPVRYINSLYPTNGQLPTYKYNNILE